MSEDGLESTRAKGRANILARNEVHLKFPCSVSGVSAYNTVHCIKFRMMY